MEAVSSLPIEVSRMDDVCWTWSCLSGSRSAKEWMPSGLA